MNVIVFFQKYIGAVFTVIVLILIYILFEKIFDIYFIVFSLCIFIIHFILSNRKAVKTSQKEYRGYRPVFDLYINVSLILVFLFVCSGLSVQFKTPFFFIGSIFFCCYYIINSNVFFPSIGFIVLKITVGQNQDERIIVLLQNTFCVISVIVILYCVKNNSYFTLIPGLFFGIDTTFFLVKKRPILLYYANVKYYKIDHNYTTSINNGHL